MSEKCSYEVFNESFAPDEIVYQHGKLLFVKFADVIDFANGAHIDITVAFKLDEIYDFLNFVDITAVDET